MTFTPFRHQSVVEQVPQLKRGQVWCIQCGQTRKVDSGRALALGWPLCCGQTMTIDSPEERQAMSRRSTEPEEHEANAHLIAAAPELLEACKAMIRAYEIVVSNGGGSFNRHFPDAAGKGYAAIRKVEGQP